MPNAAFEPGDELCPPWWPRIIFDLHHWRLPGHWHGPVPGPVNYPPAIQDLMASVAIHTFSYLQLDQEAAQRVRAQAEAAMIETIKNLGAMHDQAVAAHKS